MPTERLNKGKALYFKEKLKAARDSALEDAEAFSQICFAIEDLGSYLVGGQQGLGGYQKKIKALIKRYEYLIEVPEELPEFFNSFEAYYDTLRLARNDAMHSGAFARHATEAGKSLCLVIEEALMAFVGSNEVKDFMVRAPVYAEPWQPVAFARQMMLLNSFSFLPIEINGKWHLLTEIGIARYLFEKGRTCRKKSLVMPIKAAIKDCECGAPLKLVEAREVKLDDKVGEILQNENRDHTLWVVIENKRLVGVLSPFELM